MMACLVNVNAKGTYRGFVSIGPSFGHGVSLDFTTVHGYQFNKNWFAGIGVGLINSIRTETSNNFYVHYEELSIPIFIKVRFDILSEKALTWFADANIGYAILDDGFVAQPVYASTMIGLRQRLAERLGLNFGVGASLVPSSKLEAEYNWSGHRKTAFKFNVKLGVDF